MASWGNQYSTGDQGNSRITFWRSGFKTCPQCQGEKIKNTEVCAGCRHNGDGYGTEEFKCEDCGWNTSFQYDEAAETYYYETRGWDREPKKPLPPVPMNEELEKKFLRIQKVVPKGALIGAMRMDRISHDEIEKFLREHPYTDAPPAPAATGAAQEAKLKAVGVVSAADATDFTMDTLVRKYSPLQQLLPEGSVRMLMQQDGVPRDAIESYFHTAAKESAT